jgi:hypothetical protein
VGADAEGVVSWVPGSTCCWGAVATDGCDEPAVRIAWRDDIIDANPLPRAGIVAVPVCAEHGDASREWTVIDDREAWVELQESNPARVWLVEALSPVR